MTRHKCDITLNTIIEFCLRFCVVIWGLQMKCFFFSNCLIFLADRVLAMHSKNKNDKEIVFHKTNISSIGLPRKGGKILIILPPSTKTKIQMILQNMVKILQRIKIYIPDQNILYSWEGGTVGPPLRLL